MHKEISPSACLVLFLIICNGFDSLVWFGRPAGGGETPKDSFFRGAAVFFSVSPAPWILQWKERFYPQSMDP